MRYRLTRTDVEKFTLDGYIEERVDFGSQTLTYSLQQNQLNNLSAIFEDNKITVFMPKTMVDKWKFTGEVGFEYNDNGLFLLVEKDFKCLDNVAEDQSDNYPNPLAKDLK